MPMKDPKDVFVALLSDVRQNTEKATKAYQEISQVAQDPDIKEVLESRALISNQILAKLDECLRLIGEKPVKIQSPTAKRLFVLVKLSHLVHLRMAEYVALVAAADITGNHAVGVLLESCLADKLAFIERTKRLIRRIAEARVREAVAA